MIHLDTSFPIGSLLTGSPEECVLKAWIGAGETLAVSVVAWAEFLSGPPEEFELQSATDIIDRHIDFAPSHAKIAARLFNLLGRQRRLFADCMIAATAMADNAPIATSNERDFRQFESAGPTLALS